MKSECLRINPAREPIRSAREQISRRCSAIDRLAKGTKPNLRTVSGLFGQGRSVRFRAKASRPQASFCGG